MKDFPPPRNHSETESEPLPEQQQPQQQPLKAKVSPLEVETSPLDAEALPLGARRRYFVFNMVRKSLDEKLGISFQESDALDGGMEVLKIEASVGLLAARWNEAVLTAFPENTLQPGDVAYKLHDGTPCNKDAIYSLLRNTLDIWIVFYREEGPGFSFTISEGDPGTLVKVTHPEVKKLTVSVTVPASRKAGDVCRVLGAHA